MFSVALLAPAVVGRNVTDTVVEVPGSRVDAAGRSTWNCDASAPVMVKGVVSVNVVVLLLVMLTGATLALPRVVAGNASVAGDAMIAGPPPPDTTMSSRKR